MHPRQRLIEGWPLAGVFATALMAMVAGLDTLTPDRTEALRMIIRATARTSLVLFLLAFAASGLARLRPGGFSAWLLRNRRQVGVGFAVSHLLHLAAIVALARRDPILFDALTTPASYIFGGLGYAFILAMLATSFDTTARAIGPRAFARLHGTGIWFLWLMFLINFGKRIPAHPSYVLAIVLACAALAVRIAARRRTAPAPLNAG